MNTGYLFTLEDLEPALPSIYPIWERHYAEMKDRLAGEGIDIAPFNPMVSRYVAANKAGSMFFFTVRCDGLIVGYSMVYLTNDMHTGELIAREDTIYIVPEHRNGVGKRFTKMILHFLKGKGATRAYITAVTDPRATKLWGRLGFRLHGQMMSMDLKGYA